MAAEIVRIAEQLRRAVEGNAWHGPAVLEILQDVDAPTAAAHPIADAHSIWEILNHITVWTRAPILRLGGQAVELDGADDWPPVSDTSEASWQEAVARFRAAQQELLAKLKSMSNDELGMTVPGKNYSNSFMLYGVVQHHLYHAGQMAVLKKATKK
ncbi:MAG: DinB family protein [Acidobacteriia bacterium]|nr:DinB family protein [Terriglobia bacterium]